MIFTNLVFAGVLALLLGVGVFCVTQALRTYLRYRGKRLITCPETHRAAAVHVDVAKAANSGRLLSDCHQMAATTNALARGWKLYGANAGNLKKYSLHRL